MAASCRILGSPYGGNRSSHSTLLDTRFRILHLQHGEQQHASTFARYGVTHEMDADCFNPAPVLCTCNESGKVGFPEVPKVVEGGVLWYSQAVCTAQEDD